MGAFQGKWERGSGVKIPSMPTLPICCPLHGIDHCSTLWVLYVKLFGFRCLTCVTKKEFCHLSVSSAGALCDGGWPSGARRGWQLLSTGCLSVETEALTCSHGPLSSLSTIQSKSNFQMSFSLSFLKDPTNPFFFFLLSATTLPTPTFPENTSLSVQHPHPNSRRYSKIRWKISALGGNLYHFKREVRKGHEEKVEDETV